MGKGEKVNCSSGVRFRKKGSGGMFEVIAMLFGGTLGYRGL
ncbi:hypothetical protein Ppha_0765 [Pelodictyon phaeoclathratiforme BU-1]|uniref:Uncharacterized protein n=1 Tax=Pelodictyon phaeoclathratiforme (strain DSM 5477 / BU-1) TaxID=324925 RepID=B4SEG5_PELPB|nr:hypothetical protein Ppha_0765 [Pelodictyon phaeoclathratiforme BU-1]